MSGAIVSEWLSGTVCMIFIFFFISSFVFSGTWIQKVQTAVLEKDELSKLTCQRNESKNKSQRVILMCFLLVCLGDFHVLLYDMKYVSKYSANDL